MSHRIFGIEAFVSPGKQLRDELINGFGKAQAALTELPKTFASELATVKQAQSAASVVSVE